MEIPTSPKAKTVQGEELPEAALMLDDAMRKNQLYQVALQEKQEQIHKRLEEIKQLNEPAKALKDFQLSCKTTTGRPLGLKGDPRIRLISNFARKSLKIKVDEEKSPLQLGPVENFPVTNYQMLLEKYPNSLHRESWSANAERENLQQGVKQQIQDIILQSSTESSRESDGSVSIKDIELKPEILEKFVPMVNWEQLAMMYVSGRSGVECQARWVNKEDPRINHEEWTTMEDKELLRIVGQRQPHNWLEIAAELGTSRTPGQCLTRYQRSLNVHILKREWTAEEDAQLRLAVEAHGECNWPQIASDLEGRTGTQCFNRWMKTLNPARDKVGKWSVEEDERLIVAVRIFGPNTWNKIAQFVPGRTQAQCRERWFNCLDPSLKNGPWAEDEDSKLKEAIQLLGHRWSEVAKCVTGRTDSQCRRRWKTLFPHEEALLQEDRRIKKTALISNFVERKKERPKLGPSDFDRSQIPGAESGSSLGNEKRKRGRPRKQKDAASCQDGPKKLRAEPEIGQDGDSKS